MTKRQKLPRKITLSNNCPETMRQASWNLNKERRSLGKLLRWNLRKKENFMRNTEQMPMHKFKKKELAHSMKIGLPEK